MNKRPLRNPDPRTWCMKEWKDPERDNMVCRCTLPRDHDGHLHVNSFGATHLDLSVSSGVGGHPSLACNVHPSSKQRG